jgi:hypothetical protein
VESMSDGGTIGYIMLFVDEDWPCVCLLGLL